MVCVFFSQLAIHVRLVCVVVVRVTRCGPRGVDSITYTHIYRISHVQTRANIETSGAPINSRREFQSTLLVTSENGFQLKLSLTKLLEKKTQNKENISSLKKVILLLEQPRKTGRASKK